jgi:hypothetical protein
MEEFTRQGFKGHKLMKLNECRMFLEVVNLAEITTVDRKNINLQSWKGTKDANWFKNIFNGQEGKRHFLLFIGKSGEERLRYASLIQ